MHVKNLAANAGRFSTSVSLFCKDHASLKESKSIEGWRSENMTTFLVEFWRSENSIEFWKHDSFVKFKQFLLILYCQ